ncbi:MAG: NUDIX hydrolase [Anaerolineae bacterium]
MSEWLDIYDDNLMHLGTKLRADVHRDGDWHRVFHCWVMYHDVDGRACLIVQKRASNKAIYPNHFDVSSAGHYEAGETPREGIREVQEELGLTLAYENLIPLGRRISMTRYDGSIDREVADVHAYICDQALSAYHYQQSEIDSLIALDVREGLRLFAGEISSLTVPAVGVDQPSCTITVADFVPAHDHYWQKICLLTPRCLNGETYLFI